jgi:hypothetical protein
MKLRRPTERLADVCWLPRFIDKARAYLDGTLTDEYRRRFGSSRGMDGAFLRHFELTKEAFLDAVRGSNGSDIAVAKWFYAQPSATDKKVEEWNALAPELGKPGQSGYEVLQWAMEHIYKGSAYSGTESIFDVIEGDEAPGRSSR